MSQEIDPREVLAYLNELGYTNISAQQLKEFIKDLKKVMKYDSRFSRNKHTETVRGMPRMHSYSTDKSGYERDDGQYEESGYGESSGSKENEAFDTTNESDKENVQPLKHSEQVPKIQTTSTQRNKHIAVHIYDTRNNKPLHHRHCAHLDQIDGKIHRPDKEGENIRRGDSKPESSESTIKCIPPCSTRTSIPSARSRASSKDRKSKVTFIRPTIAKPSINKCDPVALYHYYQSEWKKSKIPGQDSRDDLRWAIRERMMSGPRVEVKTRCNIPRCGWSR